MEFDLTQATDVLSRTPTALRALLAGIGDGWSRGNEGPDTFSAFDNVGHLIDADETDWIPRMRVILARGTSVRFEPFDRQRHRTRNVGRTLESLLDEFATLRESNLRLVASWTLGPAELDLPGEHPTLGRVTLRQLFATWAVHDLGHLAQVSRVIAKQYTEAVGPWVAFLPVLTDHLKPRS